jgi:hypothetical protein
MENENPIISIIKKNNGYLLFFEKYLTSYDDSDMSKLGFKKNEKGYYILCEDYDETINMLKYMYDCNYI